MEEKEDKPTIDIEVVDGEELVDGVAADKEGDELMAWLLVSLYHQPLVPETSQRLGNFPIFIIFHLPLAYFIMFHCSHL